MDLMFPLWMSKKYSSQVVPKTKREYDETHKNKIEINYKAKKLLVYGIDVNEYNMILARETTKETSQSVIKRGNHQ